jgi:uncharacterized protein YkwD
MRRLILTLIVITLGIPMLQGETPIDETRTTLRAHLLRLINRDRAVYGLPPVELDVLASAVGDDYCRAQIRNRTTGHFTTDGLAPYVRYSLAGGNDGVSENAAAWSANYTFNERALYEMARRSEDAMMAEAAPKDGHKRTILDPHATHVGIGFAWEKGEFRLVQEFIRRYVDWTRPLPRRITLGESVIARGRPLTGRVDAITVHYEPLPAAMPAHVANAIENYTLPERRHDYLPRLAAQQRRLPNGMVQTIRRQYADGTDGHFTLAADGTFTFDVPFQDGPGLYTVVVWVRKPNAETPVAATNVTIRAEAAPLAHYGTR